MPLLEAVRQSGARRLRPILLTTLTTALALLPMALGLAGVSKSYGPFAAALTFGLMVAMLGTLFAVPLSYTSLIVLQERLRRRFSAALRPRWLRPRWARRSPAGIWRQIARVAPAIGIGKRGCGALIPGATLAATGEQRRGVSMSAEVERGRAMVEQAARELCQARGGNPPELQWGALTDAPQRVKILIEGLDPIEIEFGAPTLADQGGMAAARFTRRKILDASRSR